MAAPVSSSGSSTISTCGRRASPPTTTTSSMRTPRSHRTGSSRWRSSRSAIRSPRRPRCTGPPAAACGRSRCPATPACWALPSWHDAASWDPVLTAIEEHGMPLLLHIGTIGESTAPGRSPDAPLVSYLTLANLDVLGAVVELAYSPVLHHHPELEIVVVEGGAGWLPYLTERIDFFWRYEHARGAGTVRDVPPSQLLGRVEGGVHRRSVRHPPARRDRHRPDVVDLGLPPSGRLLATQPPGARGWPSATSTTTTRGPSPAATRPRSYDSDDQPAEIN